MDNSLHYRQGHKQFIAHFGGREEIQLNPLIATRVFYVPRGPWFPELLIHFHPQQNRACHLCTGEMTGCYRGLSTRFNFEETVLLNNRLKVYYTANPIVYELKAPNKTLVANG